MFSSCMGGEFSYEKYDIENGFFTEALLKSLSSKGPDKDNNAIIDTEELKNYVIRMVSQETGNLQHPTVDRDNLYLKFGFPLLSADE